MKELIVTLKTSTEVLGDFKKALKNAKKSKLVHNEISFDTKRDFDKFIRNIYILSCIITFKPGSIYELARLVNKDVSNINKIVKFYEEIGIIKLKKLESKGRVVLVPSVKYDSIKFNLAA